MRRTALETIIGVILVVAIIAIGWIYEQRTNKASPWRNLARAVWGCFKLIYFGIIAYAVLGAIGSIAYEFVFTKRSIEVSYASWGRGPRDHLVLRSLTLRNTSPDFQMTDPVVRCDANGNSGTTIQSVSVTVYEKIPPNGSIIVPRLELPTIPEQATSIECRALEATQERVK